MQEEILKLRKLSLETDEKEEGFFIDLKNPFSRKSEPEQEHSDNSNSEYSAVDIDKLSRRSNVKEIDDKDYLRNVQ